MSIAFRRSDQPLHTDGTRRWFWGLIVASLILATCLAWAVLTPLSASEVTTPARPETEQQLKSNNSQIQIATLTQQLDAFEAEIEGAERALRESHHAIQTALKETSARIHKAKAQAQFATREAKRTEREHEQGYVSEAKWNKMQAEARQGWAALGRLRIDVQRQLSEHQTQRRNRQAHLEQLIRERDALKDKQAVARAKI